MIGSICSEPRVLEVMRIVNIIILIIKIAIPIILIVIGMLDFAKAVSVGADDALPNSIKTFVKRIIVAILIFLIPTFISIIFSITSSSKDYKNCLEVRTKEEINAIYLQVEEKLVAEAESSNNISDYTNAYGYLINIKDDNKRQEFQDRLAEVKKIIDEKNKSDYPIVDIDTSSDYGKDIPVTDELKAACKLILNQDKVKIRLIACSGKNAAENPSDLPGGGTPSGGQMNGEWVANSTIPLSRYRMGMFFGEIGPLQYNSNQTFFQAFSLMYTTFFLNQVVPKYMSIGQPNDFSNEYTFYTGECAQVYKDSQYNAYYVSGQYKSIIDTTESATRYLILANKEGHLVHVRYNTTSHILEAMYDAASSGKDVQGVIDATRNANKFTENYVGATVYDCRNIK